MTVIARALKEAVAHNEGQSILFSGGIDSGIVAHLCPEAKGITVALEGESQDLPYVSILKDALGMETSVIKVSVEEALSAIPEVVRVLKSFDFIFEENCAWILTKKKQSVMKKNWLPMKS